jgi:hypothetical protein
LVCSTDEIALMICDGPPDKTRGGRYGLVPALAQRLENECVILADDADRPSEQRVLAACAEEFGRLVRSRTEVDGRSFVQVSLRM